MIKYVKKASTETEEQRLGCQEGKKSGKLKVESGKLNNFQFSTFNFQLNKAAFTLAKVKGMSSSPLAGEGNTFLPPDGERICVRTK